MSIQKIDAKLLSKMFLAGAASLESKKEWINELNVFPVPDGDTGTNMTMTIMSAAKEVAGLGDAVDIDSLCKAISGGSLRGARGNSGVILSQLFRGFTKAIKGNEYVDIPVLTEGLEKAVETAYKAVMKPKEGTILTVARGMSEKAHELFEDGEEDLESFIAKIIEHGDYVLSQTPELLPVLKQAGVVDSGGQGLMEVLRGCFDAYLGKETDFTIDAAPRSYAAPNVEVQDTADIKFGYCTEFIIMLEGKTFTDNDEIEFKAFLESIGDSLVCVADEDIVKIHVHTNDPGLAIQRALTYGSLSNMKIDNMRLEHQEKLFKESEKQAAAAAAAKEEPVEIPHKEVGFLAISAGEGLKEIFVSLGVDYVIEGGQTMNPSTADILDAVEKINADNIFILPNNKNIILAANQAASLVSDKKLIVIPTKTVPQGITAVINYVPELSAEENAEAMTEEIANVKTGQVTYAVRDTVIDDKEIKKDDFMGIGDQGIISVGQELNATVEEMIAGMSDEDTELISLYYGSDISEEDAAALQEKVAAQYPSCDVELQYGGQPIYYYIVSAE